jgi:hypothetical protein
MSHSKAAVFQFLESNHARHAVCKLICDYYINNVVVVQRETRTVLIFEFLPGRLRPYMLEGSRVY